MLKRICLGLLIVAVPSVAVAQVQENYLPAKTQLYFRWDGMEKHQADFKKSAVGKMLQGETGVFLDELWKYVLDNAKAAAQAEPKIEPMLTDLTKVVVSLHRDGMLLGVEVDKIKPPMVRALIVFPKAAGESGTILQLIHKIGAETKVDVQKAKVGKRVVHHVRIELLRLGWWAEGSDAVVFLGTTDPVAYAQDIDAKKTGIAKHLLYQKVANFKEFKTAARGYVDLHGLFAVAWDIDERVTKIIDETGLNGLRNITFVSGFDGASERSIADVDASAPRKGLLSLTSQKKISLKDMPVMPSDMSKFSASSVNLSKTYDVVTNLIVGVARIVSPDEVENIKEGIKGFQNAIGVDFGKDLFENFGDVMVTYSSPSDGFLGTGAVVAIQVKDGKKIIDTFDKLKKAIPPFPGGAVSVKNSKYRGGEIIQIGIESPQTNAHIATLGIYKNWFIYTQYPTAIKGFIMRQEGDLPAWKPDESLNKVLAQFPNQFTSIQVSDPRPVVQTALSIAPFALSMANQFGPLALRDGGYRPFDLNLIPHPQEATRHLFPNVTVGIDDGKRIRTETRGSLLLPF
ncbi:MAG: hypothetical protein FJ303_15445 [Planctomycetes bacterium]|nr:hypothetical protein [Planctomycetota bacterium]